MTTTDATTVEADFKLFYSRVRDAATGAGYGSQFDELVADMEDEFESDIDLIPAAPTSTVHTATITVESDNADRAAVLAGLAASLPFETGHGTITTCV